MAEIYFFTEPQDAWKMPSNNELVQVLIYATVNLITAYAIWIQTRIRNQLSAIRNQQKKWFINLSHEVRNAVYGLNELIDIYTIDSEPSILDRMKSSSKNLVILVKSVFDYSKVESKQMSLIESPCFFKAEIVELAEIYKVRSRKKNLSFEASLDKLPENVFTDEQKIVQILSNLLDNALKYTDQGKISFKATVLEDIQHLKCSIRFSITDTGCGIFGHDRTQIFNPFFRSDSQLDKVSGLGLGLSISSELAKLLGGEISFEPNSPIGSKFHFDIQVSLVQKENFLETENTNRPTFSIDNASFKILLVEDSIDFSMSLRKKLENLGCQVLVSDGTENIKDYFYENNFEYIFIDLNLQNESGVHFLRRIRQLRRETGCSSTIIGMTASKEYIENLSSLDLSEFDFVVEKSEIISAPQNIFYRSQIEFGSYYKKSSLIDKNSFAPEVKRIFKEKKDERVRLLKTKMIQQDWNSLGKYAHSLRSSFLAIDDRDGSGICLDVENHCIIGEKEQIESSVNLLIGLLESH